MKHHLLFLLLLLSSPAWAQPAAPAHLKTSSETMSRIRLTWQDAADNETGFVIERAKDSDDNFAIIDTVGADTTEYLDINLIAETTYFYRIRAINAAGASAYSNTIGAATVPVTSTAPTQLKASIGVYPVPTTDKVLITLKNKKMASLRYGLYALSGELLQQGEFNKQLQLSLKSYPVGVYLLRLQWGKVVVDKRLVKW
jgi:hypothetical protein